MPASSPLQAIYLRSTDTRTENGKAYIVYQIEVHDSSKRSWSVFKRYSAFVELHDELAAEAEQAPPCALPPKHAWSLTWGRRTTNSPELIDERRQGLERYLRAILAHKDARWRDARALNAFLEVPVGKPTLSAFTSSSWLEEHATLTASAREIRAVLARRDSIATRGDDVSAARQASVEAKKKLAALVASLTRLATGLNELGKGGLAEGELRRRSNMVSRLQDEAETLGKLAVASKSAPMTSSSSIARANSIPAPSAERSDLLGSAKPTGRVLGSRKPAGETDQTRPLDNGGLLQLQKTLVDEQDSRLDSLTAVLRRQRELGLAINNELEQQNEMLDDLTIGVDRTSTKLQKAQGQLKRLG